MTRDLPTKIPRGRGVYCNRTLNLRAIAAIGYDMDYTLIQYRVAEWESQAFTHARGRLAAQGWPVEGLSFDPDLMIQGLIVDTERGNLLKVNRFGLVKSAFHGARPLLYEELRQTYTHTIVDHRDPRFWFMATLFSLSETSLFAQLVDLWDDGALPEVRDYADLYQRVRHAMDDVHQEGALKEKIAADPDRFVDLDADTAQTLIDQRDAGKKLLLITNSEWTYTSRMMSYAFDGCLPGKRTWRDLFDLVIVSARKPDFFGSRSALLEVVDDEGLLRPVVGAPAKGGIYFGGNAALVEEALGVSQDQILYVGDHFFGDVHATKNILRWRTALVVRELEGELEAAEQFAKQQRELEELMEAKEILERTACRLRVAVQRHKQRRTRLAPARRTAIERELTATREQLLSLDSRIGPMAKAAAALSHVHWGPLMRAGNDKSYLAHLIERHADIYTSRVSNLLFETPFRYFRSARGTLPHDL